MSNPLKTPFLRSGGLAALMALAAGSSLLSEPKSPAAPVRLPVDEQDRIDAARAKRDRKAAARLATAGAK